MLCYGTLRLFYVICVSFRYLLDGRPTGYKLPDTFVFKEEEMPLIAKMFQFRSYLDLQVARKAEIGSSEDKSFIWPDSSPLFDDLY